MSTQVRMGAGLALLTLGAPAFSQIPATLDISQAGHVIRRMEYGASVGEMASVFGPNTNFVAYALRQIAPLPEVGEADSLVKLYPNFPFTPTATGEADLNVVPVVTQPAGVTLTELAEVNIALALTSENQLREKMTQLWQKHFNTNFNKLASVLQKPSIGLTNAQAQQFAAHFEWQQNAEFRANALGDFRDLLETSARGLAMSIYLDGTTNLQTATASNPNQNFGRELLELHTLGVDGWRLSGGVWVKGPTYSFSDIVTMSRVFSGHELINTGTLAAPNFVLQFNGTKHFILNPAMGPQPNIPVFASNPLLGGAPFSAGSHLEPSASSAGNYRPARGLL